MEIVLTQLFADFRLPPRPSECSTAASKEGTDGEKQVSLTFTTSNHPPPRSFADSTERSLTPKKQNETKQGIERQCTKHYGHEDLAVFNISRTAQFIWFKRTVLSECTQRGKGQFTTASTF